MSFETIWTNPVAMVTTTLHSLPNGAIWHSGLIHDASPTAERLSISYTLVFATAPVSAAHFDFWVAGGDEGSAEIWDGGMSETAGQITTAATIAETLAALGTPEIPAHSWQTSHGATFRRVIHVPTFNPAWQFCIRAVGGALASSGNVVRYRYASTQG